MTLGVAALSEVSVAQTGGNSAVLSSSANRIQIRSTASLKTALNFPSHARLRIRTAPVELTTKPVIASSSNRLRIRSTCVLTVKKPLASTKCRVRISSTATLKVGKVFASTNCRLRITTSAELKARASLPFVTVSDWPDMRLMFVGDRSPVAGSQIDVSGIQPGEVGPIGFSFDGHIDAADAVLSGDLTRVSRAGAERVVSSSSIDGRRVVFDVTGTPSKARFALRAYLRSGAQLVMTNIVLPLDFS